MAAVDPRTKWMAILATLWGLRLTANFYRRGGYSWPLWRGEEDYRWAYIQKGHYLEMLKHPLAWSLFNLVFISFYQNFLLLLIVAPSFVAWTMVQDPSCRGELAEFRVWGLDGLATVLLLVSLVIETVADNQQYRFQTEKYRQIQEGLVRKGEYADGFCQSGLFAIVRKPNYAAEQLIWISYYLFSVAATATGGRSWWHCNWSLMGCFLLVILFQGSGRFTEKLTLLKYPEKYAEYQRRVPLYFPIKVSGEMRHDKKDV
jgi:steroid 5-alpha reductase family enzyme